MERNAVSLINTRTHQAIVAIAGMVLLAIGLAIIHATGTPTPYFREEAVRHRALYDLGAYVLPILAAVAAGAGLFIAVRRLATPWCATVQPRRSGSSALRTLYGRPQYPPGLREGKKLWNRPTTCSEHSNTRPVSSSAFSRNNGEAKRLFASQLLGKTSLH
jgi:hypothetical protein